MRSTKFISVIIPCYHAASFLRDTVMEICRELKDPTGDHYQIILVNDHSPDETFSVIRSLCAEDSHILGIDLEENVGQARARLAAIPYIEGSVAVFMDDDGQHPARGIRLLADKAAAGWHLVYAQFPSPRESLPRRFASRCYNLLMTFVLRKPHDLRITSFFAVDARGIKRLKQDVQQTGSRRPNALIGSCFFGKTKKITGVVIDHMERRSGSSDYTFRKLVHVWYSMVVEPRLPVTPSYQPTRIREICRRDR